MNGYTVLIVDDEPSIVDVWTRILLVAGYDVVYAADATEALRVLDAARVTVAICDVHMPGASGLWLADMIRERYPATAIVLASGDPLVPPGEALRPAVVAYIVKRYRANNCSRPSRPVSHGRSRRPESTDR
jgi:CheY-like chemotaxis protein